MRETLNLVSAGLLATASVRFGLDGANNAALAQPYGFEFWGGLALLAVAVANLVYAFTD